MIDVTPKTLQQTLALASKHIFFKEAFDDFEIERQMTTNDALYGGTYRNLLNKGKLNDIAIIAFRGSKHLSDYYTNFELITQMRTTSLTDKLSRSNAYVAGEISRLQRENSGINLYITGHSLGGIYAQNAAISHQLEGACFNSPGLPLHLQSVMSTQRAAVPRFFSHRVANDKTSQLHRQVALGKVIVHKSRYANIQIAANHNIDNFIRHPDKGSLDSCCQSCQCPAPDLTQAENNQNLDNRWFYINKLTDYLISAYSCTPGKIEQRICGPIMDPRSTLSNPI